MNLYSVISRQKAFAISLVASLVALTALRTDASDLHVKRAKGAPTGHYTVRLREDIALSATQAANELSQKTGIRISHIHSAAIRGFSFKGPEAAAEAIARDPRVTGVTEDEAYVPSYVESPAPSWSLDRIDHIGTTDADGDYTYYYWGTSVYVYVIDSGEKSISDLYGRVLRARNFVPDANGNVDPSDFIDCRGHGTAMADIIAGTNYGVAKGAYVVPLRVFPCDGSGFTGPIVNAIDWMVADHLAHPGQMSIANLSFETQMIDSTLDDAVMRAVNAGITVVTAAGNGFGDSCSHSPSHLGDPNSYSPNPSGASVITVGASTYSDSMWPPSAGGRCVDIFAPGDQITYVDIYGVGSSSGTSNAAAIVSGVAALHLERMNWLTPSALEGTLKDNATPDVLSNVPSGSPNLLLYSLLKKHRACCAP